jgi:hypothetical protein
MLKWTEAGLLISADQLLTDHGLVICQMSDEIQRLNQELKWWRDYAFQMNTNADNEEEPF